MLLVYMLIFWPELLYETVELTQCFPHKENMGSHPSDGSMFQCNNDLTDFYSLSKDLMYFIRSYILHVCKIAKHLKNANQMAFLSHV